MMLVCVPTLPTYLPTGRGTYDGAEDGVPLAGVEKEEEREWVSCLELLIRGCGERGESYVHTIPRPNPQPSSPRPLNPHRPRDPIHSTVYLGRYPWM